MISFPQSPGKKPKLSGGTLAARAEYQAQALDALVLHAERLANSLAYGQEKKRKPGTGEEFWQFRLFQSGDTRGNIDWRRSAKNDQLFVRETEQQISQTSLFWCAGGPGMDFCSDPNGETKKERAALILTALAYMIEKSGGISTILSDPRASRGRHNIVNIATSLLDNAAPEIPLPQDSVPHNATLIAAGDFWEPPEEFERRLALWRHKSSQVIILHIMDDAEINLPYTGAHIVEDSHNKNPPLSLQAIETISTSYRKRIQDHCQHLESISRKYDSLYIRHNITADTPLSILQKICQRAEARRTNTNMGRTHK